MDLLYSYSGEISTSRFFLLHLWMQLVLNFNSVNFKGEINPVSSSYM